MLATEQTHRAEGRVAMGLRLAGRLQNWDGGVAAMQTVQHHLHYKQQQRSPNSPMAAMMMT